MPPPDWKSAIEIHPDGWLCPAGAFWIAGWATSASGLVSVDVRAWLGDQAFLGLCGLPRPDKEIEARGRAGAPQAGFSFLLHPVAGANELRVELCDQHGRWTKIFRQAVTMPSGWSPTYGRAEELPPTTPAEPARPPRDGLGVLSLSNGEVGLHQPNPQPILRLLRAKHARPGQGWMNLAREILTHENAETFDVMPSEPFKGALEQLEATAAVQYDHLLVTGWVAHREQKIKSLTAYLDSAVPLPLVHGLPRPDARTLFPDLVDAEHSCFAGYLPFPAELPRPLALRIFAELADGRQELVFLKRFQPVLTSGAGTDLPAFSSWKFVCATWALRNAGWDANWPPGVLTAIRQAAREAYRVAAPALRPPPEIGEEPFSGGAGGPQRVTLVTHNLNFEGAPLFLVEYARHLATQPGWTVRVVSPTDGPLRTRFAEAGVSVRLVDPSAVLAASDEPAFTAALDRLAQHPAWSDTDVIVVNTMVAFWAVHVAHRLRKPSVFYVHESVGPRRFFALQFGPAACARVEQAFTLASRVAFLAHASQHAFAALGGQKNFRVMPGWIDIARIRAYETANPRADVRRSLGFADNTVVFANLGAVLPRKGQHVFLAAIALLQQLKLEEPCAFLIVGVKPGIDPYVDLLRHTISAQGLENVQLIESSSDPYRYFRAADICVCSSLEEALPRVVMEAAAFGRAIVTTDVDGIPELVGPEEAWFAPPDDARLLADAMAAAMDAHLKGDHTRANRARELITAHSDAAVLLPRHTDLIRAAAAQPPS